MVMVKKIIRSFTFWFVILSIMVLISHQLGQDPKSIVLISLNPILNQIAGSEAARNFMNSGYQIADGTLAGHISIYWYIGSVFTFIIYGLVLDGLRSILRWGSNKTKTY